MVHIKFTARPQTPIVSPKFASMALEDDAEVSTEQREISAGRLEGSMAGEQVVTSPEAASEQGAGSDRDNQSEGSSDSETASDNREHVKIEAEAALAGMSYDFGQSKITKACLMSLESFTRHFPKGCARPLGAESIPDPQERGSGVQRFLRYWSPYTSTPGPCGYFVQVPSAVASTDAECHCSDWQVCLGCHFLRRSYYYKRFLSSL
jgi:hypothetical protein